MKKMDTFLKWLNDARVRSITAGGLGGLAGWFLAEVLLGKPFYFWQTLFVGLLVGTAVATALNASEGIVLRSWSLARRGLLIGFVVGAIGGVIGATFGQATFTVASVTTGSGSSNPQGSFITPDYPEEIRTLIESAGGHKGEIEVALIWKNSNDLDLHVVDPLGEEIYYGHNRSQSQGWLDVDRNAGCSNIDPSPVEHVRWPEGAVPNGEFKVYVNHYSNCGARDPTPFQVAIKTGGEILNFDNSISHGDSKKLIHVFERERVAESSPPPVVSTTPRRPSLAGALAVMAGWAIFGALVGCAEGLTRRSWIALRNASLGGAIGGCLGGAVLVMMLSALPPEPGSQFAHAGWMGRLLGFVILGSCIGLWIVLIERALSAVLVVRSGRNEGREIFLDKRRMRLGRNDLLDIYLGGDSSIASHHATIRAEEGGHMLSVEDGAKVLVNDAAISNHRLQDGDRISIGNTKLDYRHKSLGKQSNGTETHREDTTGSRAKSTPRTPPPAPPVKGKTERREESRPAEKQARPPSRPQEPTGKKGPPPPPPAPRK